MSKEHERLRQAQEHTAHWRRWGPYLSERQWGTVREDYSADGDAWAYFPHDQARSRAYRWGEDGLLGLSDNHQRLCFAVALWNGKDPILKERLFGLANGEGNHGEDVKECYYYLDNTPTHSYMKALYKYPQASYPYLRLVEENRRRGKDLPEFELIQTGVFDEDRYFDVFVEYAKADVDDILIRITAVNRGSGRCRAARSPNTLVQEYMGLESGQSEAFAPPGSIGRKFQHYRRRASIVGQDVAGDDGSRWCPVHGKRNQSAEAFRQRKRFTVCQGRHRLLCGPRKSPRRQS